VNALFLNCTLKPSPETSNSEALAKLVAAALQDEGVETEFVRLTDHRIKPGVESDMGDEDEWPAIRERILGAEILVFATPTWLGQPSSVSKLALERMDAMLSETDDDGRPVAYNRVAGVVVTGNEDGAHAAAETTLFNLTHLGCAIPPNADTYWVGDAGPGPSYLEAGGPEHPYTQRTSSWCAHNLLHMARIMRDNPIPPIGNTLEDHGGDAVHVG
jgi:multimeric flavodoxin WrbA